MDEIGELPEIPRRGTNLSRMAEDIAVQRFADSNLPEDERICYDPYAVHFIDPGLLQWGAAHPTEVKAMAEAWAKKVPGWSTVIRTRVRYFDDTVIAATENGCEQLVILGAGYDTRAYRLEELKKMTVFEVDRSRMLHAKTGIIRKIFRSLPGHVQYVPADLSTGDPWQGLHAAGYSADKKTLFVLEGLVMYLPRKTVLNLLTFISSHTGPGSTVLFDYVPGFVVEGTSGREDARIIMAYTRKSGEPFLTGFDDGEVKTILTHHGFADVKVVTGEDLRPLYLHGKNAGISISDLMLFVSAGVP